MKVALKKKAQGFSPRGIAKGAAVASFILQDNQNDTCTVFGVDNAGNQVDISTVASLTPPPTSSDTTKITVGAPTGMTFNIKAVGPLTAGTPVNITVVATWNDGSIGPFTFTLPVEVQAGPTGGIIVVPGVPVVS